MLHISGPMLQGQAPLTFAQWGTPPEGPPFPSMVVSKHIPSAKKTFTCDIFEGCSKRYKSVRIPLLIRACLLPLQGSPAFRLPAHRSCAIVFLMYVGTMSLPVCT